MSTITCFHGEIRTYQDFLPEKIHIWSYAVYPLFVCFLLTLFLTIFLFLYFYAIHLIDIFHLHLVKKSTRSVTHEILGEKY